MFSTAICEVSIGAVPVSLTGKDGISPEPVCVGNESSDQNNGYIKRWTAYRKTFPYFRPGYGPQWQSQRSFDHIYLPSIGGSEFGAAQGLVELKAAYIPAHLEFVLAAELRVGPLAGLAQLGVVEMPGRAAKYATAASTSPVAAQELHRHRAPGQPKVDRTDVGPRKTHTRRMRSHRYRPEGRTPRPL